MKNVTVPYLSGGIFFLLLTEAKGRQPSRREIMNGKKSGITYNNMLEGLIQFLIPSFNQPRGRTFSGNTSEYRACTVSYGEYLPFDNEEEIQTFDKQVKNDYESVLKKMNDYISSFLDSKSENRMRWLIKALLTIIEKDNDMAADTMLYTSENPIKKEELLALDHYCLSNLLLALWHFIVLKRHDNELGRSTFTHLNTRNPEKHAKWKFNEDFGRTYTRPFEFDVLAESDFGEKKGPTDKAEPEENEVEEESSRIQEFEVSYCEPISGRQVTSQIHVEAKDNATVIGQVFGGLVIDKRGNKND